MSNWVNILDLAYPVGSVYITTSTTSPASTLGGTWSAISEKFLYGHSTNTPKTTGGSSSHTHKYKIAIGVFNRSLTYPYYVYNYSTSKWVKCNGDNKNDVGDTAGYSVNAVLSDTFSSAGYLLNFPSAEGVSSSTSHLPPYYTVRMWVRTA